MTDHSIQIAPSMLSADFSNPALALEEINRSGASFVHLDVMDGSFVPEITFGSKFVKDLRPFSDLPFDVHLMVNHPQTQIDAFVNAGSDYITIHQESSVHLHRVLQYIKSKGVKCGISIVPSTPVCMIKPLLNMVDLVLVMTVNPGYGGQVLIQECLEKVIELKEIRDEEDYSYLISVDGGVNFDTIQDVASAGADIAVTGSAFFKAEDKEEFIEKLLSLSMESAR